MIERLEEKLALAFPGADVIADYCSPEGCYRAIICDPKIGPIETRFAVELLEGFGGLVDHKTQRPSGAAASRPL